MLKYHEFGLDMSEFGPILVKSGLFRVDLPVITGVLVVITSSHQWLVEVLCVVKILYKGVY